MPILQPDQVREIINAIPSFRFEENSANRPSTAQSSVKNGSTHKRSSKKELKEDNSKVCNICLDQLKSGVQVKMLQCAHIFHAGCINNWLKQKQKCPTCRHRVTL